MQSLGRLAEARPGETGEYNIERLARVYGVNLSWDDNGAENVELQLSKNSATGERKVSDALRKLRGIG